MDQLCLVIRIDREMDTSSKVLEELEARIEELLIGEAVATMSALGETMVFVDLPEHCTERDLPDRIAQLERLLAQTDLGAAARVEIPKEDPDADEDEGDE